MKTVLITGASSGIGLQLAKDYADAGWHVIACGRRADILAQQLPGERVSKVVFDIQDPEKASDALAEFSSIDLAILNAGTCEYIDDALAFDLALFKRVIDINVIGTANCLTAVLPKLKAGSHLAIVSSTVTTLALTRSQAYGASKSALDYLTLSLAVDLAPTIDVSLIRPGFVETPLTDKNDFAMPGRISVKKASVYIMEGLAARKKIINFPPLLHTLMTLVSWLPNALWHRIAVKMRQQ